MQRTLITDRPRVGYWPFSLAELEVALALLGLLATSLALYGASLQASGICIATAAATLYLTGLLAHGGRQRTSLKLHLHGAEHGVGYVPLFCEASHSLLLMHVDDDCPSPELQALYARLLEKGVRIRRIVVERSQPAATQWARDLPEHPGLRQLFLPAGSVLGFALSFAVIDEHSVIVALPGIAAVDNPPYHEGLLLRHLVHIRDATVASAFAQTHEALWRARNLYSDRTDAIGTAPNN